MPKCVMNDKLPFDRNEKDVLDLRGSSRCNASPSRFERGDMIQVGIPI